jgi:hypothetical protein
MDRAGLLLVILRRNGANLRPRRTTKRRASLRGSGVFEFWLYSFAKQAIC